MTRESEVLSSISTALPIMSDPKSHWDKDTFERQVEIAVNKLLHSN